MIKWIIIFILLLDLILINPINIINFNLWNIFVIIFLLFFVYSIFMLFYKKNNKDYNYFIKENILILSIFLLSTIVFSHFLIEHSGEENLYLRIYGKIAFIFFAWALSISPIIQIFKIKSDNIKNNLILLRKVLWILTFLFLIKHWLEYFSMDYVFFNKFPHNTSLFTYIYDNLFKRYDALSWVIAWIFIIILWITSNKFSVKVLWKYWKYIQMLAYPTFIITLLHIALSWRFDTSYAILLVWVVWLRTISYLLSMNTQNWWKVTKYLCVPCGYIYDETKWDEDGWIPPWTKFEDIPDNWVCPVCWVWKKDFIAIYENEETIEIWAQIIEKKNLTENVVELVIETEQKLESQYWQFAKLILEDRDGKFQRSYSIVKQDWNKIKLCIKALDTWRWGKIINKLEIWDKISLEWIFWNFILQDTTNPKVFIATWTGLAPIINMINHTKTENNQLFFWVQNEKDLFYLDKILWENNLKTEIFLSKEKTDKYNFWRLNLSKYNFPENTEFYICWNPSMVNTTKDYLSNKWFNNIYFEQFN